MGRVLGRNRSPQQGPRARERLVSSASALVSRSARAGPAEVPETRAPRRSRAMTGWAGQVAAYRAQWKQERLQAEMNTVRLKRRYIVCQYMRFACNQIMDRGDQPHENPR